LGIRFSPEAWRWVAPRPARLTALVGDRVFFEDARRAGWAPRTGRATTRLEQSICRRKAIRIDTGLRGRTDRYQ
jgi:hypothetical protein